MNIYHYRHIMVANTPGKLNIICATTHAKKNNVHSYICYYASTKKRPYG